MLDGEHIELLSQEILQGNREALDNLTHLATTENKHQAVAAFRLGLLHDGTGPMGCLNDLDGARHFYHLAASLGYPEAQFFLGNMYEFGEGVPQDWAIAREWYELAANNGELNAQMNLARIYQKGRGCEKDATKAALWYLEAAKRGDEQAATNLALMHLNNEVDETDLELALQLLEFSATKLDGLACKILGEMYLSGSGVEQSYDNALIHLCLAKELLPAGSTLEVTKKLLDRVCEGQDPSVMDFFVEKSVAYIGHIRGSVQ